MLPINLRPGSQSAFVVALTIAAALAVALLAAAIWLQFGSPPVERFLPAGLAILTCLLSYFFYKTDRLRRSALGLIAGLILAVVSLLVWPDASFNTHEVYLLLPVVALAGLLLGSQAALWAATGAIVATLAAALARNGFSWDALQPLLFPLALTAIMAAISRAGAIYLAQTWQQAQENAETARQFNRDLFKSRQELQHTYELLKTARLRLQEAERTADKASELKNRFISNLSHELRTPLTAIINFSYILSETAAGEITEEQRQDYLHRIYESGEMLRDIANDLLDLAKIEAGQMELFWEPLNLAPICVSVMNTVSGLIEGKPITLCQEIPANLPQINADKVRIQQILLNLLGNAAKYTNQGHITLRVIEDDGKLKVSVIDTGIGIKKQDFERIFEEFQQTEEAFALRKPGAGLGLAISKKFVELLGGELWVESEIGQGSTFYFTLPITAAPPTRNETAS